MSSKCEWLKAAFYAGFVWNQHIQMHTTNAKGVDLNPAWWEYVLESAVFKKYSALFLTIYI